MPWVVTWQISRLTTLSYLVGLATEKQHIRDAWCLNSGRLDHSTAIHSQDLIFGQPGRRVATHSKQMFKSWNTGSKSNIWFSLNFKKQKLNWAKINIFKSQENKRTILKPSGLFLWTVIQSKVGSVWVSKAYNQNTTHLSYTVVFSASPMCQSVNHGLLTGWKQKETVNAK